MITNFLDDHPGLVATTFLLLMLALCAILVVGATANHNQLIEECMADNKKRYECEAMFKQDVVAMPVVIPMGR